MFLVEQMGFGWDEVHDIAEQVEHVKAPAFFDRMDELVGFPTVDHGSPIPDAKTCSKSTVKVRMRRGGEGVVGGLSIFVLVDLSATASPWATRSTSALWSRSTAA